MIDTPYSEHNQFISNQSSKIIAPIEVTNTLHVTAKGQTVATQYNVSASVERSLLHLR